MDQSTVNNIIKAIMGFLGKNVPAEIAKPVAPVVVAITVEPLTKADLLMGRDKEYPADYTQEISDNLDKLLIVVNKIQQAYGKKFTVNSGWRSPTINANQPGAAPQSNHMKGLAVDVADADGAIMNWTLANLQLMKDLGVHMEDWRWCPTWTHYQCVPPKSGNRIYIPSTAPALAPDRWVGHYEAKYNA